MKDYRRFQTLHFFRFLGDALFFAFLTIYFKSLNFDSWKLGTLLAIVPFMAIAGSLVLGKLAGTTKRNLLMLKIMNIVEASFMIFFGFIRSFPLLVVFDIVVSFCNKAFYSLLDSVAVDVSDRAGRDYAKIRIFGSLAYLISSFCGGYLIDLIDYRFVFMIAGALFLLSDVFLFCVRCPEGKERRGQKDSAALRDLFHSRSFVFYLLFYILALGASNVSDNIFALYVSDLGMSENRYGTVFAMMVFFEIVTMLIVTKLSKPRHYRFLLLCSGLLIAFRNVLYAIPMPLIALSFIPALRGIAWGTMLGVHLNTLKLITPKDRLTKAIFILNIFLQVYNVIFNQTGPRITDFSYSLMFGLLAVSGTVGALCLLFVRVPEAHTENGLSEEDKGELKDD